MGRVAVVGLIVVTACSFVSVRVPDRAPSDGVLDCSSSAPAADTAGAIVALALGGALLYSARTSDSFGSAIMGLYVGLPLVGVGVIVASSAIWGYVATRRCERMADAQAAQREDDASRRADDASRREVQEVLWEITKVAAASARGGDCARVIELAAKLRSIDREFHDVVLARDVAIARCLADASAGAGSAAPP